MIPITVVTPVGPHPHNTQWLPKCINSVEFQSVSAVHWFVIDGPELVKKVEIDYLILESFEKEHMHVIVADEHIGPACVNLGIAAAETDWVVILNSDDYLFPDAIKILTARIEEVLAANRRRPFYLRFSVNCNDGTRSPGGQCFHKEVWEHAGRYPNALDLDFQLTSRILERGQYKVFDVLASEPVYFHRYHEEQMMKTGKM